MAKIKADFLPEGTVGLAKAVKPQSDDRCFWASEAARHAAVECSDLQPPRDEYAQWKTTVFAFGVQGTIR
jgi:hypothetical protein